MTSWIPLIATSVGVTLGAMLTFISQWIQCRRQRAKEIRDTRLSRLEELYEVLTEILQHYKTTYSETTSRLVLPASRQVESSSSESMPIPFHRMEKLVTIYAPSLQGEVDSIINLRDEVGELLVEAIFADRQPEDQRQDLLEKLHETHLRLDATINQARANVASLATSLLG